MENHTIPQDVTGFKFKLIGSITVKQFLYLLGAGIFTAIILFVLPAHVLIKIPLVITIVLMGASLAFIPIEGRPADRMIVHFIKAIPSENRYIYRKRGASTVHNLFQLQVTPVAHTPVDRVHKQTDLKRDILAKSLSGAYSKLDEEESQFLNHIKSFFEETAIEKKRVVVEEIPATKTRPQIYTQKSYTQEQLANQISRIQKQLKMVQQQEKSGVGSQRLQEEIRELQRQLQVALLEKQALEKKMFEMTVGKPQETIYKPTVAAETPVTPNVRIVTPPTQLATGFPSLPDVPNIVMGIVKDPRGKVLPNILVEVVDNNNVPVRAFKTNALGQFASATPLPNGTYKIFFEDPKKQHEFDTIGLTLTGEIFHPLEIISVDQREKLRRELFEN